MRKRGEIEIERLQLAKSNLIGKAKINGDWVDVEVYDPVAEGNGNFFTNPVTQQTLLTVLGVGVGAYNAAKAGIQYIPNPAGTRLKRTLPWAAMAAAGFFAAPMAGVLRVPVQLLGGVAGVKAFFELIKK